MRLVTKTVLVIAAAFVAVAVAIIVVSKGHTGVLIRSAAGRFTGDTNIYSEPLRRNLQTVGFRRCDYFTGLKVFTAVEGSSCPWYMSDESAVSNVREGTD